MASALPSGLGGLWCAVAKMAVNDELRGFVERVVATDMQAAAVELFSRLGLLSPVEVANTPVDEVIVGLSDGLRDEVTGLHGVLRGYVHLRGVSGIVSERRPDRRAVATPTLASMAAVALASSSSRPRAAVAAKAGKAKRPGMPLFLPHEMERAQRVVQELVDLFFLLGDTGSQWQAFIDLDIAQREPFMAMLRADASNGSLESLGGYFGSWKRWA